ncbi:hypothetical protein HD554DRAFT_2118559, partial [Boletus coccyginus]
MAASRSSKKGIWRKLAPMIPFLMSFMLFKVSSLCSLPCGRFSMMRWNHSSSFFQGIICMPAHSCIPVHTHCSPSREANS